jgi:hypothetical protein
VFTHVDSSNCVGLDHERVGALDHGRGETRGSVGDIGGKEARDRNAAAGVAGA